MNIINLNKLSAALLSLSLVIFFFGNFLHIKLYYVLVLQILTFFIKIYKKDFRTSIFTNPLLYLLFVFIMVLSVGNVITGAPQYGSSKTLLTITVLIPSITLDKKDSSYLNYLYIGSILFLFLIFLKFGSPVEIISNLDSFSRLHSDNNNPIVLSRGLGLGLLLSILSLKKCNGLIVNSLILVSSMLFATYMILAGSKGPVVAFIIACFFIVLFLCKKRTLNYWMVFLGLLFLLLLISLLSEISFIKNNRIFNTISGAGSIDSRLETQIFLINNLKDQSFWYTLFGNGTGHFGFAFSGKDFSDYPHNIILEILYENGIIGLILFIFIVFIFFLNFFKNWIEDKNIHLFLIAIYFLVNSLFSGDISSNVLFFIFAFYSTSNMSIGHRIGKIKLNHNS